MSRWLHNLNPEQCEAVLHDKGPLLILAGAGSGKTTVLVSRAGRLIEENICQNHRLCVLTFTNKAARELKSRVQSKLGKSGDRIWAGTFHSFGLFLLRKFGKVSGLPSNFGIIDATDAAGIAKELMAGFKQKGKTAYDGDRLVELLSDWRSSGKKAAEKDDEYSEAVEWLIPRYYQQLDRLGVIDFDGLLQRPLEIMQENPETLRLAQSLFDQIMVDEFQDTNNLQMRLVRQLSSVHLNLSVVGDDDQAIYGWRGACVRNILDFPKHFKPCKIVRLETNYRSSKTVLRLANHVIQNNTERHKKVLTAHSSDAGLTPELVVYPNETEEAEGICSDVQGSLDRGVSPREIAVLYRSNSVGANLEAELRKNRIPYAITGGTAFFDRKETKDVMAYIRICFRPTSLAFRRVLTAPSRGIGSKTLEILEHYADKHKLSLLEASKHWRELDLDLRAGQGLDELFQTIDTFKENGSATPRSALLKFMETVGYRKHLEKVAPDAVNAAKRWRFVEIFADVFERLTSRTGQVGDFIDAMELRDGVEDEATQPKVSLMTLHASKGLEFKVVILVGIEEDMIPHRTLGTDIAEERRLFYVGITRAREVLILTRNSRRNRFGREIDAAPSRFLTEIPKDCYRLREGLKIVSADRRKALLSEIYKSLGPP